MQHFFAVEKLSIYNIAFKGLKEGVHSFEYLIGNPFFENFENSLIEQADIRAEIILEKRSTFMSLVLRFRGFVKQTCDRCLELYDQPVEGTSNVWIKFQGGMTEESDDIILLDPEDYQFNIAQILYDYICLSIPLKHVHPERADGSSGCDPGMLKKLEELSHPVREPSDPRWNQLKSLKQ